MRRMKTLAVLVVVIGVMLFPSEVFARARYFHPVQGRFTQRDPGEGAALSAPRVDQRGFAGQYKDGANLYEYVGNQPSSQRDPSGKAKIKGKSKYGDWDFSQTSQHAIIPGKWYRSYVHLYFLPNKETVCCKEINFIQIVKLLQVWPKGEVIELVHPMERTTGRGWAVDPSTSKPESPWFVVKIDGWWPGRPGFCPDPYRPAWLYDHPGEPLLPPPERTEYYYKYWFFEDVAMCKEPYAGTEAERGYIYGAFKWGFFADRDGSVISLPANSLRVPTQDWYEAARLWNRTATRPNVIRWNLHQ